MRAEDDNSGLLFIDFQWNHTVIMLSYMYYHYLTKLVQMNDSKQLVINSIINLSCNILSHDDN